MLCYYVIMQRRGPSKWAFVSLCFFLSPFCLCVRTSNSTHSLVSLSFHCVYTTPIQRSRLMFSHLPAGRAVHNSAVISLENVKHPTVCEFSRQNIRRPSVTAWGRAPRSPVTPAAVRPDRSEVSGHTRTLLNAAGCYTHKQEGSLFI